MAAAVASLAPDPRPACERTGTSSAREARASACHSRPRVESRAKCRQRRADRLTRVWLEHARARVAPTSSADSEIQAPSSSLDTAPLVDSTARVCWCLPRSASLCRARQPSAGKSRKVRPGDSSIGSRAPRRARQSRFARSWPRLDFGSLRKTRISRENVWVHRLRTAPCFEHTQRASQSTDW